METITTQTGRFKALHFLLWSAAWPSVPMAQNDERNDFACIQNAIT